MTTKLVKWASNDGQIIKSKLSDGRRAKTLQLVAGLDYDLPLFEDYLGNVGLEEPPLSAARIVVRRHSTCFSAWHGRLSAGEPKIYTAETAPKCPNLAEGVEEVLGSARDGRDSLSLMVGWGDRSDDG
jgi:hypothetical protein